MAENFACVQMPGVTGDITETTHAGWMRVQSVQWRGRRALSTRVGSTVDRELTMPAISEMEFRKENDIASGHLMQKFFTGEAMPTVVIDFIRTDQTAEVYYEITLTDAIVSMFVQELSGARPIEVFNLNFTAIECKTEQMSSTGTSGNPFTTGYDLSTGKST